MNRHKYKSLEDFKDPSSALERWKA